MRMKKKLITGAFTLLASLLLSITAGCGGGGGGGGSDYHYDYNGWVETEYNYSYSEEYTETEENYYHSEEYAETEENYYSEEYAGTEELYDCSEEYAETEELYDYSEEYVETEEPYDCSEEYTESENNDPYPEEETESEDEDPFFDSEEDGQVDDTDYNSVEQVPEYENTNPYKVRVTGVNNIPDSAEMRYSLGSESGTAYGNYEDGNIVFEVYSQSSEEEFVVEQVDLDEYTLSTNVNVDSDVRAYDFNFDELNDDSRDLYGDFMVTITGVERKPTSAGVDYYVGEWGSFKHCSNYVYNDKLHTCKFVIEDSELSDLARLSNIYLSGRALDFNQSVNVYAQYLYRGRPKEITCKYLSPSISFSITVTDSSSTLPEHLNFANMEKEVVYTTSDGKQVAKWRDDLSDYDKLNSPFSKTTSDKMAFTVVGVIEDSNIIQINKIRIGNRIYTHGLDLAYSLPSVCNDYNGNSSIELDLSSGFEKFAIPYGIAVENVPSNLDNVLIFKTEENEEYSVRGEYSDSDKTINYNFKSPADKLDINYIKIGSKKSTAKLDYLNPGNMSPIATRLFIFPVRDYGRIFLDYETMMGTFGNVWTSIGCTQCGGYGSYYYGNLEKGNGCKHCGYQGVRTWLMGIDY